MQFLPITEENAVLAEERLEMSRVNEIVSSTSFRKRLISGIILVLLAIVVLYYGGILLFGSTLFLSIVGIYELCRTVKAEKESIGIIAQLGGLGVYVLLYLGHTEWTMVLMTIILMMLLAAFVFTYPRYKTEQVLAAFFSVFYVAVMFSYVYRVRALPDGKWLVWLIILSSWGCDTCAYAVGMLIGKHHFAPILSPKKTLEGAIGGVIGAALLGFVFGRYAAETLEEIKRPEMACAFACALSGIISQVGDFAASAIKRDHQIKDYGTLIPGHGGVLDRFDSMLFTAPAIFAALCLSEYLF